MAQPIIRVENLGKKYLLRHQQKIRYVALRDVITHGARTWLRRLVHQPKVKAQNSTREEFWALKDVSFEVKQGEVIGIVGRNGAGKSTLLKLLSRITEPTTGRVTIRGKVASLLEVGTGFHPELTGRENIYLNGAILGMTRAEIQRKFDEIVAFAEVERFLDTPVKHYSSGMYVRLAFSVAAHLEPEILVVDEVLAVGDVAFQKKCLGKMGQVATQEGRTILFVSHNMAAVRSFCNRGILLQDGCIRLESDIDTVVETYLRNVSNPNMTSKFPFTSGSRILDVAITNQDYRPVECVNETDKFYLTVKIYSDVTEVLLFACTIFNAEGIGLFSSITSDSRISIPSGTTQLKIELPTNLLNPGYYRVEGALASEWQTYEQHECLTSFLCLRSSEFDIKGQKSKGLLRLGQVWEIETIPDH